MNWIKKNPAQFGLAVVSVGLLASSYLLYANISSFPEKFEEGQRTPSKSKEIPVIDAAAIDAAAKAATGPSQWVGGKGRLFTSGVYVAKEGQLVEVGAGGPPFHPPVSNEWLLKYGLDLTNASVLIEDPDRDGFNTLLEWNGMDTLSHLNNDGSPASGSDGKPLSDDTTSPVDAASHPPYYTRLVLKDVVPVPFRLRFMSYDINPRKADDITVAINTLDRGGKTHYLTIGTDIPASKFRIEKFEKKEAPGQDGTKNDVSELTVLNKETAQALVLPLNKVVDSPESYVVLHYLWGLQANESPKDMNMQKGKTFSIPPEAEKIYKVIDIRTDEVDIQLPSGEKRTLRKGK